MADVYKLPPGVQSFMVQNRLTTDAEAAALGTEVLKKLKVMDAVVILNMIDAARKEDDLRAQKGALLVTNVEMQKINLSLQNWTERGAIAASTTWPTDQKTIDKLVRLLKDDVKAGLPALPSENPPIEQTATKDSIEKSRDRNKAIRDLLNGVSSPVSFPTDETLAKQFTAWLKMHGIDTSQANDKVQFTTGGTYFDKSDIDQTTFTVPKSPAFVVLPDGGTKAWLNANADPPVLEHAVRWDGPRIYQTADLEDGFKGKTIDTSLWGWQNGSKFLAGELVLGNIYRNGDHYFAIAENKTGTNYTSPKLFPDNLGSDHDNNTSTLKMWSDGTKYYEVDPSRLTKDYLVDNGSSIALGIKQGTPHTGFANGGPLHEKTPIDSYVSNPSSEERRAWSTSFNDPIAKLNTSNNLWGAQAQSQQVRMQEAVSLYGNLTNMMSNVAQKRERALGAAANNI